MEAIKKGQLTLEYLFLSIIVLGMLAVSITTLIEVNKSARNAMENIIFRKSSLDLYSAIEEVCALGAGNSQAVLLKTKINVNKRNDEINFNYDNKNIDLKSNCPYNIEADNPLEGMIIVKNEKEFFGDATIKISKK